jgi:hypothetical protein
MRTFALVLFGLAVVLVASNLTRNAGGEAGHLGGAIAGFVLVRWPHLLGWPRSVRVIARPPRRAPRARDTTSAADEEEIDRILDKISHQGLHSLTDQERAKLLAISKQKESP